MVPEAKQRGVLKGFYTIPIGGRTNAATPDRLLLALRRGRWVAVYFVAEHNYDLAERVIATWISSIKDRPRQTEASLAKTADEDQCPYCGDDGLMRGGRYRCQGCMRTFADPSRRTASPSGLTFSTKTRSSGTAMQIDALLGGKSVGRIVVTMPGRPTASVEGIFVDPDFRRQGIGTALFNEARKSSPGLQHSPHRTPDGDDFARSLDPDLEPASIYEPDLWMDLSH